METLAQWHLRPTAVESGQAIKLALNRPQKTAERRQCGTHPIPGGGQPRLNILLAEDHAVSQKLVVRLLEKRGHGVVVANTGQAALAAWECEQFDLILVDVQMPETDGFEVTAAIRQEERRTGGHTLSSP